MVTFLITEAELPAFQRNHRGAIVCSAPTTVQGATLLRVPGYAVTVRL